MNGLILSNLIFFKEEIDNLIGEIFNYYIKSNNDNHLFLDKENNKKLDVLICNPGAKYYLNKNILSNLENLKIIGTPSTGTNHIDLDYCNENNIQVFSLLNDREKLNEIRASSEFTFMLGLMTIRRMNKFINTCYYNNTWREFEMSYTGNELYKKSVGIIGLGRIGNNIKKYCEVFGVKDIYIYDKNNSKDDLYNLAKNSDLVFCCLQLNEYTWNLIDKQFFENMKKSAFFINTSRGEIINEEDLINALCNFKIAGAGIDVIRDEVNYEYNLLYSYKNSLDNLLITNHMAGLTYESQEKALEIILNLIKRYCNEGII